MSDVVFITPNFSGLVHEEPVGTLLLATILRDAGMQVDILPFCVFGPTEEFSQFVSRAVDMICEKKPRIVSFYTRCDTYHISLKVAEQIKKQCADTYIVFGGPQADLCAENTLHEFRCVDFICCGEGERTITPFFSSLLARTPDLTIPGLVFRSDCGIVINPRPELIPDLDSLPVLDYSLLDFASGTHSFGTKELFPVDVGRGCPFACTYCSTSLFWGRAYRLKSATRIVEEIKCVHQKFGLTGFAFMHDMFTLNRKKIIQICKKLKTVDFPIHWRCSARIDCLDEELVDIMFDAGMTEIFLGIETGSPNMQKAVKKNLKLDNLLPKLKYISSKGIAITASFIFGFPEETENDFSQTISLMTKICALPRTTVQQHLCTFFPGTELTKQYQDALVKAPVASNITGEIAVSDCEDIIHAHPALFPQFYEYQTPLRKKAQFFPQFFSCWKALRPVYEYISEKYYAPQLCDMLVDFSKYNESLLHAGLPYTDILSQDKFLDAFCSDKKYGVLKEVARFLTWRRQAQVGSTEIFGFDVNAFLAGTRIADLPEAIFVVSVVETSDGKKSLSFSKTARSF